MTLSVTCTVGARDVDVALDVAEGETLALQSDLDAAVALSVLLLLVSLTVLLSIRLTPSRLAALAARARRAPR